MHLTSDHEAHQLQTRHVARAAFRGPRSSTSSWRGVFHSRDSIGLNRRKKNLWRLKTIQTKTWFRQVPDDWDGAFYERTIYGIGRNYLECNNPFGICRFKQAIYRSGWPFCSLEWEWQQKDHSILGVENSYLGAIQIGEYRLPIRLLPRYFAFNAIFYAVIILPLFAAPEFVRRRYRIKRGLCPSCAYPIGESEVCTECGAPFTAFPQEITHV